MKVRKLTLKLHSFMAIITGLLLVMIGLTGSAIVFHKEIDHALNRSFYEVTPQPQQISLDEIMPKVQQTHPDLPIQYFTFPQKSEETYMMAMETPNHRYIQTFVNPYTGEILGSRIWEQSLMGFLYSLHHDLFSGKFGMIIIGFIGLFMLIIAISGVILWTGWRKKNKDLKIRFNASSAIINYDLHQVGGIISSLFLIISALTGIIIVWAHFLPMFAEDIDTRPLPQQPPLPITQLLAKADAAMPEGKITLVGFSEEQPRKITVTKKLLNQKTDPFDFSTVEIDKYTGEILHAEKVIEPNAFLSFLIVTVKLHFGNFGGLLTRIFYILIGLMPSFLLVTGLILWKRKQLFRVKQKATSDIN